MWCAEIEKCPRVSACAVLQVDEQGRHFEGGKGAFAP